MRLCRSVSHLVSANKGVLRRPCVLAAAHIPCATVQQEPASSNRDICFVSKWTLRQSDPWFVQRHAGSPRCHATSHPQSGAPKKTSVLTLPTLLTIARVASIPFLIAAWFHPAPWATTAVTAIFVIASLTDWLDGYLARTMNLSTAFGAFLDPVADKLMVAAVLILLTTQPLAAGPLAGNTWLMPCCTLAIIGREITMSALREWAAALGGEARSAVAVSSLGKWKTAAQMTSLTLLLILRDGPLPGVFWEGVAVAGPALLLVATFLTLLSLADYLRALWRFLV